jgi:hypothetical protein
VLRVALAVSLAAALVSTTAPAGAFEAYPGIRPLGMGGASRAWAIGDAGPILNPSGMSILKTYTIDGAYQYAHQFSESFLHASIVDGTSSYNIAGGVYYTYHLMEPGGGVSGRGHEGGLALSMPFGEYAAIGATVKYFRLLDADAGPANHSGGVTFDVGATIRPTQTLSFAVVGTNLHDLQNGRAAPFGVSYGAASTPIPNLLLAVDGMTSFDTDEVTGRKWTAVMGGGEWTVAQRLGLRAGGGYDGRTGNGYLTAGLSGISEIGAFDAGFRQDISQHVDGAGVVTPRETVIGVSLRLFVPASQTQPPVE